MAKRNGGKRRRSEAVSLKSSGGAGWTRTTDNAIMSRALYHLSYGTSCAGVRLTSRLSLRFLTRCLAIATRFRLFIRKLPRNKDEAGSPPASWLLLVVAEVGFEPTTFGL